MRGRIIELVLQQTTILTTWWVAVNIKKKN